MNRSNYFNYIEEKLDILAYRIEKRGKINLLDLHIYSETFFAEMMNKLWNYHLRNLNIVKHNMEGIDLIDAERKIIAQISSTCTKQKIESSLSKEVCKLYNGYRFKFVSISKNADNMRNMTFKNPHAIIFEPKKDIIDITSIHKMVLNMDIMKQKSFFEFIKSELGNEIDIIKVDSNLATIIHILSAEMLSHSIEYPEVNSFEINKKIEFNNLSTVQDIIDEYKIYYSKLDEKYSEFDKLGANKSLSVFRVIKSQYTRILAEGKESHELFFLIIDKIIDIILNSKNYIEMPYEELEMCVYIIVVDAFIRCKIFVNPEGYNHVTSR